MYDHYMVVWFAVMMFEVSCPNMKRLICFLLFSVDSPFMKHSFFANFAKCTCEVISFVLK